MSRDDRAEPGTMATENLGRGAGEGRTLLVIGRQAVSVHALPERGALVMGRSRGVDLLIDDRSVSRRHARLVVDGGRFAVEDLGSANGTRIGHQPVGPEPARVRPGEPFHLGAVTLVIEGAGEATGEVVLDGGSSADTGDGAIEQLHAMARRLAAGTVSVLIQGETGVGKELLAERIHQMSPRAAGPYVRLNCAAIAENLLESELFGHERGAFTGAHQAKPGLLELAEGGTLFLDEVGELPLGLQAKILRAVEERLVRRVGGVEPRAIDVRFVSASNRDLEDEVDAGRFRRDLYYRLAGATLYIPPLRERRGEIRPLAARFVAEAGRALGRERVRLVEDAVRFVTGHDWPGNVRELRSACERAVLLCDGDLVRAEHFQVGAGRRATTVPPGLAAAAVREAASDPGGDPDGAASLREEARREVEAVERRRILEALDQAGGNQTRAAALLGISRRTLINRLDAYGMPRPRKPR